MNITLYKTLDSNNVINKNKELIKTVDIKLKKDTDISYPIIELMFDIDILDSNYLEIPIFKRFYFIEDIKILSNNIVAMKCKVDVLESFKDELLDCDVVVSKRKGGLDYINSNNYEYEVKKEVDIYNSDVILPTDKKTLIITMGNKEVKE